MIAPGPPDRTQFLLSQYDYSKSYDLLYRELLFKVGTGLVASVLAALTAAAALRVDRIADWLSVAPGVVGAAVLGLAGLFLVANTVFNHLAGNTFLNDINALRIEESLGLGHIGLWHTWYGFYRGLAMPQRRQLTAWFCNLQRATSYLRLLLVFTVIVSVCILLLVWIGTWPIAEALFRSSRLTALGLATIGFVAGTVAALVNFWIQLKFIRHTVRAASPEFQAIMAAFGLTSQGKSEALGYERSGTPKSASSK